MAEPEYLELDDLRDVAGTDKVLQIFDDDGNGEIDDDETAVLLALSRAEQEASSYLRRNYGADAILKIADEDAAFRGHVAWVAMQFASERRGEFVSEDGTGRFKVQYERAIEFFKDYARSSRTTSSTAGPGANAGGKLSPARPSGDSPRFVFAADRKNTRGSGGY